MKIRDLRINRLYVLKEDASLRLHRSVIRLSGFEQRGVVIWEDPSTGKRGYINARNISRELLLDDNPKFVAQITEIVASSLTENDVKPRVQEIIEAFKAEGYVKLADDQTPKKYYDSKDEPVESFTEDAVHSDIWRDGWRKVILP